MYNNKWYINCYNREHLKKMQYNTYIGEPKNNIHQILPKRRQKEWVRFWKVLLERVSIQFIFKDDLIALWFCQLWCKHSCMHACADTRAHTLSSEDEGCLKLDQTNAFQEHFEWQILVPRSSVQLVQSLLLPGGRALFSLTCKLTLNSHAN